MGEEVHGVVLRYMQQAGITDYGRAYRDVMAKIANEGPRWALEYLESR